MDDLQTARANLAGHTLCLCKGGKCLFGEKRGIAPMMELLDGGADLSGYCAADLVVGAAAAFLFVKGGVVSVFAKTLSVSGKKVLEENGVGYEYETLTEYIIDRTGTGVCPMEQAVRGCTTAEEAYQRLKEKREELKKESKKPA